MPTLFVAFFLISTLSCAFFKIVSHNQIRICQHRVNSANVSAKEQWRKRCQGDELARRQSSTRKILDDRRRFALDLQDRILRFRQTGDVKRLHPGATRSTNRISIPKVTRRTYHDIQSFVNNGQLNSARHWKVDYKCSLTQSKSPREAKGNLSYRIPCRLHDQLKKFAADIRRQMWDFGSANSFYPPNRTSRFIVDSGPQRILLYPPRSNFAVKQPDAGLKLNGSDLPFLVLEVTFSDTVKDALKSAREYIKYSKGRIVFAIVISVSRRIKAVSIEDLNSLSILPDKFRPPRSPTVQENNHRNFDLLSRKPGGDMKTKEQTRALNVWVYKKVARFNRLNRRSKTPRAIPIIANAEIYPKQCPADIGFEVRWSDISSLSKQDADKKFTVHLSRLHAIAEAEFKDR